MGWRRGYNKNKTCKHDITIQKKPNMKTMQLRIKPTNLHDQCEKFMYEIQLGLKLFF